MSELINVSSGRGDIRWKLLASASATVLMISVYVAEAANGDEGAGRPTVWIELGGQLERVDGGQEYFAPEIFDFAATPNSLQGIKPSEVERPSRYAFGGEGAISFAPHGLDWIFSASVRYGQSDREASAHQQSQAIAINPHHPTQSFPIPRYAEAKAKGHESHFILDFMAGKDVGLGLFGRESTSQISAGVRFAQFSSRGSTDMYGKPDNIGTFPPPKYLLPTAHFHQFHAFSDIQHNFHGIGPSLSWKSSLPIADIENDDQLALDWGLNAAALFGRQKTLGHHQTSGTYHYAIGAVKHTIHYSHPLEINRSRTVIVPNVGGFAGLSMKFPNAKVSFGYRADLYFGAMDGGVDERKSYDRDFYGPFATISIGLGG